ncbi:RNA 2',3'-cyclic phosphodiesterase [Pseudoalteromonas sp. T1lg48]|uniref:RNA 2',3'-cyclic phosphodiesterase n=1 Tax=Pseudoalteromonas sp. T1lg48 TaxID=2077100 RepID=UPI000CF62FD7|nr:RNA 2',3'-cyclic phosphodiesterase [Pseudoalteromonas sp. T1lg48]
MGPSEQARRLFFALGLSAEDKQHINHWLSRHVSLSKAPTQRRNWHLTLMFLGQVEHTQAQQLIDGARKLVVPHFSTTLDEYDYWPHNGIFHLRPSAPAPGLLNLAGELKTLARQQQIVDQHARYRPHVTLARNLKKPPTVDSPITPLQLEIDHFTLYHSTRDDQGLVYLPLAEFACR